MMDYTGNSSGYAFQQAPVSSSLDHQNPHFSSCAHQNLQILSVPLQTSCHFCKNQVIKNLSNSYCQAPVQIKLSVPFCENSFGSTSVRNPLENELLQQAPPSHFLSYQQNTRRESRGSKRSKFSEKDVYSLN